MVTPPGDPLNSAVCIYAWPVAHVIIAMTYQLG